MMSEPMSDEAFTDIANAILRLRRAFLKHHMEPPKSIELATIDEGHRFRYYMPKDMVMMTPRQPSGNDPEWVCTIAGMEVRFPGQWRAREKGGRDFV
jgi:hypothetical protein